jgi:hypothetical protein
MRKLEVHDQTRTRACFRLKNGLILTVGCGIMLHRSLERSANETRLGMPMFIRQPTVMQKVSYNCLSVIGLVSERVQML